MASNPFHHEGDFHVFSPEDVREAEMWMHSKGVGGLPKYFQEKLSMWRNIPLRIGIAGESGVGKSSFINQIRGLTADDKGGAAVGIGDTTLVPTAYPHPYNDQIVFWDLPGVGTPKFPQATYCKEVGLDKYDFFLVLSDDRFTNNDVWLAREIEKQKKNLFFIRTKIDNAMENAQRDERSAFNAEAIVRRIKEDCEKNFAVAKLQNRRVYVISNYETTWDYEKLMKDILDTLPHQKRLAMVLSLGPISRDIIQQKTTYLQQRVWKVATVSAVGSAAGALVPIPVAGAVASLALDVGILIEEISFYLKQYGIDEASLKHLAERTNTKMDVYVRCLKSSSGVVLSRKTLQAFIMKILQEEGAELAVKEGFKWVAPFLPVIGAIVSGAASFGTSYKCLNNIITAFKRDAEEIVDKVIELTSTAV